MVASLCEDGAFFHGVTGWLLDLTDEQILERLLALNLQRAAALDD